MRKTQHSSLARSFMVAFATLSLGLALGCPAQPSNDVPPQKTGEGPNDPNVKTDDVSAKKKVKVDENPEPNPDGIELKPVGQGGGPKADDTTVAPPTPPPPVKKPAPPPVNKPKPKPTTTPSGKPSTTPSSTVPPVWTPPPLPSGWTWPFPTPSAAPSSSSTTLPPIGGFGGS